MIKEVANKIYKFRLPMPGRLDHINVYLLQENQRLALIDTGLPTPDSWKALNDSLEALNLHFSDLTDIFVTHSHPDHIGQLHRIRKHAPTARLHIHRVELSVLQERSSKPEEAEQRLLEWFLSNGANEMALNPPSGLFSPTPELGTEDRPLAGGEKLVLSEGLEGTWEIIWTPGHTAGHFVILNRARRILLSGDHLLGGISSNIGKYPGSTVDPLGDYMNSLQKINELDLQEIFPAHGLPFKNYRERLAFLLEHHKHRLEKMYAAIEGQPVTATEVVKSIWGDRLDGFDRFLALGETLSHLERLVLEKRVIPEQHNNLTYYRVA
ncbi:MAG: MBL fold metallo-hydrolase [Chloroflexota bacterium]|nr:MBL fold metallo-hydrolase [Chloroflexota bacterium]